MMRIFACFFQALLPANVGINVSPFFHPSKKIHHVLGPLFLKTRKTSSSNQTFSNHTYCCWFRYPAIMTWDVKQSPVVKKWEKLPTAAGDYQDFGKSSTVPELPNSNPVKKLFQHTPGTYITPRPQPTHYQNQFLSFRGFFSDAWGMLCTDSWKKMNMEPEK